MKVFRSAVFVTLAALTSTNLSPAQRSHDSMKGKDTATKQPQKAPAKSSLKPAEGASVKILTPTKGQTFQGRPGSHPIQTNQG